jgi:hypothetical protein
MDRRALGAFALLCILNLAGCASHYSRHMSETYKDAKLEAKTFAILPLAEIDYHPPSSCMGSGGGSGAKYQEPWTKAVGSSLKSAFPKHTFRILEDGELEERNINPALLYSQAADEISGMGVTKLESSPEAPKLSIEPSRAGGKVGRSIRALGDSDKVDYVIILASPKMTGEVHHTYNAQGGASAMTVYTSDVQFGVWSVETGELAYASGAISASSGFCIFVSPQQASINGTTSGMAQQLKALIARLLKDEAERVVSAGRQASLAR